MNEQEKKILDFVKSKGPALPVEVKRELGGDTMLMGALLSGLIENKCVRFTNAKIGGSPLYYVSGQEGKLSRLKDHLSEKPAKAYDLLKENKVLRDKDCEPWQRVALREIKDFAMPLDVNINGGEERFWKWYMLSDGEAEKIVFESIKTELPDDIKDKLASKYAPEKEQKIEEPKKEVKEDKPAAKQEEFVPKEAPKIEKPKEVPKPKRKRIKKEEETYKIDDDMGFAFELGRFHSSIMEYFKDKNIVIIEQKVLKRGKEFSFVLKLPSTVGRLGYFVVAKDKKKVTEKELSDVYSKATELKMPAMFICTGALSKRARKFIEEKLPGMVFRSI